MDAKEIQTAWRQLLDARKAEGSSAIDMPSIETNTTVSAGSIRLAIADDTFCAVLLPVSISDSAESDQISELVTVRPITLGLEGKAMRFLEVRCEDEHLNEVFARVVGDILRRVESGTGTHKAVDEALKEFRRLLHKQRVSSIDEKTIVGLIGELLTLIEVIEVNPDGLGGWHGPDSDRHDFRAGPVTIEVKTSLGADGNRIHINGMKQLEYSDNESLLIRHIRIEPDPDGTLTVPDLAAGAAALLTDQILLDEKLKKLGYTADTREGWQTKRYKRIGASTFEVKDGFPRLIPAILNKEWPLAGVSSVSYEVDLGAASGFKLDQATWEARLREFCECL